MAFFGVEVKPAKRFTHPSSNIKGRLRISQATLGVGSAANKSLVQCNVGNKSPVLLCVLIPDKTESCHLDLEFDEAEDVIFSVIGPRSVYLTGYFVSNNRNYNANSDTESYGEDVGKSESDESYYCSNEDRYEDSFIDDDEPEISPPSPISSDGGDIKTREDGMPKYGKANTRQLKKRCQIIESDDDTNLEDSEDDDNYLLSVFKRKRTPNAVSSEATGKTDKLTVATAGDAENLTCEGRQSEEMTEAVNVDGEEARESGRVNHVKPKKKRKGHSKDVEGLEAGSGNDKNVTAEHTEAGSGVIQQDLLINHKKQGAVTNMETEANTVEQDGPKSKKRRKDLEGESVQGNRAESKAVRGGNFKQDTGKADNVAEDVPVIVEVDKISGSKKDTKIKTEVVADGCLSEKKTESKKKKKSNTQKEGQSNMVAPFHDKSDKMSMKFEDKHINEASSEAKTLSNGLVIEEVAKGEPDGKVAAPGKKVKVYYTAMLKENGHVFDSNVGKRPYKFRLGNDEVIEGWNLGIDGMHVGDKRRLVIPPSMGFGKQGAGENVPPNSWLVYEVELVRIHR